MVTKEDYTLLMEAQSRLAQNEGKPTLSESQVMNDLGITENDIQEAEEPEFE